MIPLFVDRQSQGRQTGPDRLQPLVESLESRELLSVTPAATSGALPARDVNWIRMADSGDALEIQLGNLAQTNASSPDVKSAGARMVSDHTASLQILEQTAASLGVTVNGTLSGQDPSVFNRLSKLNGTAFDEAYSAYMVRDHLTEISSYTRENLVASDATLKQITANEIPVLQDHLTLWKASQVIPADVAFVKRAAGDSLLEITLGNLAQTNASNADVKTSAQRMVTDHTASNAALATVASSLGITLPTTLSPGQQAAVTRLSRLTGRQFDLVYSNDQVGSHRLDIADYSRENHVTTNLAVKTYLADNIPVLQSHLSLWQTTLQTVRSTST